jgi:hypothetical protein
VPARVLRAEALVRAPSFPAAEPRVQLDHLLGRGVAAGATEVRRLAVGDHRLLLAEVIPDGALQREKARVEKRAKPRIRR